MMRFCRRKRTLWHRFNRKVLLLKWQECLNCFSDCRYYWRGHFYKCTAQPSVYCQENLKYDIFFFNTEPLDKAPFFMIAKTLSSTVKQVIIHMLKWKSNTQERDVSAIHIHATHKYPIYNMQIIKKLVIKELWQRLNCLQLFILG